MFTRRIALAGLPLLALPVLARPAAAQQGPTALIESFHTTLLDIMRNAQRLGARGRYDRLSPVMSRVFDLNAMTRIAVGPAWTSFSAADQQALTEAFSRWSIATYAARFDGYAGETFTMQGAQSLPNGDQLVRTTLNRTGDQDPVILSYLVRNGRVVDVYLTGTISELASRRSEFAGLIRDGGADRLTQELTRRANGLLG